MIVNIKGYQVEVDEEDAALASLTGWCPSVPKKYGRIYFHKGRNGKTLHLHRLIMKAREGQEVDHIDGNTLDNRKVNMRLATSSQNKFNKGRPANNKSGYKGVHWLNREKLWRAQIKGITLGYFHDPVRAAEAYKQAAVHIAGEFARW